MATKDPPADPEPTRPCPMTPALYTWDTPDNTAESALRFPSRRPPPSEPRYTRKMFEMTRLPLDGLDAPDNTRGRIRPGFDPKGLFNC